jgi:hypothetical protein
MTQDRNLQKDLSLCRELNPDSQVMQATDHVGSALGSLHRVDVGRVADVSEVHVASIFRVEMIKVNEVSA